MPKRPVFHAELGQFFRDLRLAQGWGLRQAARIADERGLTFLNMNSLGALERGSVKNPDPELFRELSSLYKRAYSEIVGAYLAHRYKIEIATGDLLRPSTGVEHVTSNTSPVGDRTGGSPHETAATRALRDVTLAYETFFRAVQDVSDQLARIVQNDPATEGRRVAGGESPRRRRGR